MYEEIKKLISDKAGNITSETLTYFTNYFYVLVKKNLIPKGIKLDDLIDNAIRYASKVEFYDQNHRIYLQKGADVKGFRDPESKTIFIRDSLAEPLREMVVYHELHHAVQTNPDNDKVGINQESNIGRLIMEAQTQYFAEMVYSEIHGISFEEREIPTENLRMINNGTVVSSLHNYEMYDAMLSKLAIILGVPKSYFVSINFLYKNNEGLKDLESKYNVEKQECELPYSFQVLLLILDYIYSVDLTSYVDNQDKEVILSGRETESGYEIHPGKNYKLSLQQQRNWMNKFDVDNFLALVKSGGNFKRFSKYVVDNEKRQIISEFVGTYASTGEDSSHKEK